MSKIQIIVEDFGWSSKENFWIQEKDTGKIFEFKGIWPTSVQYGNLNYYPDVHTTIVSDNKAWSK